MAAMVRIAPKILICVVIRLVKNLDLCYPLRTEKRTPADDTAVLQPFTSPQTGGRGNWIYPAVGIAMMAIAGAMLVVMRRKKE